MIDRCFLLLQAPFRPPKPPPPEVTVITGAHTKDMLNMFNSQCYTDLVLIVGTIRFSVHRFMLASSSNAFHRLALTIHPPSRKRPNQLQY